MPTTRLVCIYHGKIYVKFVDKIIGFKLQALLLSRMFYYVDSGKVGAPLYTPGQAAPGTPNSQFLREFVAQLLINAFSHLQPYVPIYPSSIAVLTSRSNQVKTFVDGLFALNNDLVKFKLNLRDFLIQLKEFSAGDNADLFAEDREIAAEEARRAEREKAARVGGLIKPSEMDDVEL